MAVDRHYDMKVHPTGALVRSETDGARAYSVTFPSCDCADFLNRKGLLIETEQGIAVTLCKHIIEGLMRVGGWHRAMPEPELHVNLDLPSATAFLKTKMPEREARSLLSPATPGNPAEAPATAERGRITVHRHSGGRRVYDILVYPVQPVG